MVWRVCEHPDRHDYDTSSVRSVAFGGSPSADELQRMIHDTFPNVSSTSNAYGLTETSSVGHGDLAARTPLDKPTSVGPPVPTVQVKIVDADGEDLAPGRDRRGAASPARSSWPATGTSPRPPPRRSTRRAGCTPATSATSTPTGFLFITDRKKDMIIRGGENIYCVEIEQRLVDHPDIADAAIIGVPHPELGEEVKAVVQLEDGATLTEADVRQWVADGLAAFKVPDLRRHLRTTSCPATPAASS